MSDEFIKKGKCFLSTCPFDGLHKVKVLGKDIFLCDSHHKTYGDRSIGDEDKDKGEAGAGIN